MTMSNDELRKAIDDLKWHRIWVTDGGQSLPHIAKELLRHARRSLDAAKLARSLRARAEAAERALAAAVAAETERCARIADRYAEQNRIRGIEQTRRANKLGRDPFGHGEMAEIAAAELAAAQHEAEAIAAAIRAPQPGASS